MSVLPITSRELAIARLDEARAACVEVRNSTLAGLPLYEAMRAAIGSLDDAIAGLERMRDPKGAA